MGVSLAGSVVATAVVLSVPAMIWLLLLFVATAVMRLIATTLEMSVTRRLVHSPGWPWGAVTGFDSGDPRWPQDHTEHDEAADGEELALPVLHGLEPEVRRAQELPGRDRRRPLLQRLLLVVVRRPAQDVPDERQPEEREQTIDRLLR
jgi:hypothetical protein